MIKIKPWKQIEATADSLFIVQCLDEKYHIIHGQLWKIEGYYRPRFDIEIPDTAETLCKKYTITTPQIVRNILMKYDSIPWCEKCINLSGKRPIYLQAPKDDGGTGKATTKKNPHATYHESKSNDYIIELAEGGYHRAFLKNQDYEKPEWTQDPKEARGMFRRTARLKVKLLKLYGTKSKTIERRKAIQEMENEHE